MEIPHGTATQPDRLSACEEALETPFNELMDMAWEAGWTAQEAAVAITSLADHFILKICANDETMRQIADIRLKRS